MSAEPVADHSFSSGRHWRDTAVARRLLETEVGARRGVATNVFTVAPTAMLDGGRSAFGAEGAR
jgi:hypothetical protein